MKNYFKKFSIMFVMALMFIGIGSIQNGTVANAASTTWNPNDKFTTDTVTFSNGDLTVKTSEVRNSYATFRAMQGKSSGKWYFETKLDNGYFQVGVQSKGVNLSVDRFPDRANDSIAYYNLVSMIDYSRNNVKTNNIAVGDYVGVAIDMDNRRISFYKNGIAMSNAININLKIFGVKSDTLYPVASVINPQSQITTNFGATPFKYNIPDGYVAYDSSNTQTSSITLNKSVDNLQVNQTDNLVATTTPAGAEVTWTSSDSTIATVDSTGKVTGVKEGTCTVTATLADGTKATCTVTVTDGTVIVDPNPPVDEPTGDGNLYIEMVDGNIKQAQDLDVADFIKWFKNRDLDDNDNPIYKIKNAKGNVEYLVHDKVVGFEIR